VRTLIAGFGNVLRGDDGFGVAVVERLRAEHPADPDVEVIEIGTAGIRLAQELLTPCDRLIIVDAVHRGAAPGTVHVSAIDAVEPVADVDPHLAVPARALSLARALGAMPREVFLVGCEPLEVDELTTELSPPVRAAVDTALRHIRRLLDRRRERPAAGAVEDPVEALRRRDEILQVMFWLHGEGLGPDVAVADVLRFVDGPAAVQRTLGQLAEDGHVEPVDDGAGGLRYRLTALGADEGRRRFLDEFEPYLARRGHGECGSADCDCHRGGECREPA
jgi:hydrogenase maturation protease